MLLSINLQVVSFQQFFHDAMSWSFNRKRAIWREFPYQSIIIRYINKRNRFNSMCIWLVQDRINEITSRFLSLMIYDISNSEGLQPEGPCRWNVGSLGELSHGWHQRFMDRPFPIFHFDALLPPRALERRLQEDWAKDAGEDLRVLMSLRVDFGHMG